MKTETKARPIIFSGPMVRAIRDRLKTQTRRVVKPQPGKSGIHMLPGNRDPDGRRMKHHAMSIGDAENTRFWSCPYLPGDLLWVREAWQVWKEFDHLKPRDLPEEALKNINFLADGNKWDSRVRSPIHLPETASRLTLEVERVRVERVQEISEADAIAEGFESTAVLTDDGSDYTGIYAYEQFWEVWDYLNAKRGYLFESNPWVFAYKFKVREASA